MSNENDKEHEYFTNLLENYKNRLVQAEKEIHLLKNLKGEIIELDKEDDKRISELEKFHQRKLLEDISDANDITELRENLKVHWDTIMTNGAMKLQLNELKESVKALGGFSNEHAESIVENMDELNELKEQEIKDYNHLLRLNSDTRYIVKHPRFEEVLRELNQIVKGITFDINNEGVLTAFLYQHYEKRLNENEAKLNIGSARQTVKPKMTDDEIMRFNEEIMTKVHKRDVQPLGETEKKESVWTEDKVIGSIGNKTLVERNSFIKKKSLFSKPKKIWVNKKDSEKEYPGVKEYCDFMDSIEKDSGGVDKKPINDKAEYTEPVDKLTCHGISPEPKHIGIWYEEPRENDEPWECPICHKTVYVGYTVHRYCLDDKIIVKREDLQRWKKEFEKIGHPEWEYIEEEYKIE